MSNYLTLGIIVIVAAIGGWYLLHALNPQPLPPGATAPITAAPVTSEPAKK